MRSKFTVDDYSHYLFTPRDLTNWIQGLLRYNLDSGSGDSSTQHLLEIWAYEARRLFRDRLVGKQGLDKFDRYNSEKVWVFFSTGSKKFFYVLCNPFQGAKFLVVMIMINGLRFHFL